MKDIEISDIERQKEQKPAEWSNTDKEYLAACIEVIDNFCVLSYKLETLTKINVFRKEYAEKLKSWLESIPLKLKNELSEEDKEEFIISHQVLLGYPIDANGNIPNYNQTFESCKNVLVHWLKQNLQKMLAHKRIDREGIVTETLLKDSYIQAYREGIEDSIRELSLLCENSSLQSHWKPTEE